MEKAPVGLALYELPSWSETLQHSGLSHADSATVASWLESLLGAGLKEEVQ